MVYQALLCTIRFRSEFDTSAMALPCVVTVVRCHLDTAAARQVYAGKDEDSFVLKPDVLDRADVLTMSESDPSYSELQDQASHSLQLLHSCVSLCSHSEAPSLAQSAFNAEEGKQLLREGRSF